MEENIQLSDEQIAVAFYYKIVEAEKRIDRYKNLIKDLGFDYEKMTPVKTASFTKEVTLKSNPVNISNSSTFESKILNILSDGVPRTTRQLIEEYNKNYENISKMSDFSARIIQTRKKTNSSIKTHDSDTDEPSYHGKSEWFNGDYLKDEYYKKIKSPI